MEGESLISKARANRPVVKTTCVLGFVIGAPLLLFSVLQMVIVSNDRQLVDSYFGKMEDSCQVVGLESEEKDLKRYIGGYAYTSCTDVYTYTFTSLIVPGVNLTSDKERLERCQAPCNQCSTEQVPATLQVGSTYDCWQSMNKGDLPNDLACPNDACIMILDPAGKVGDGPSPWYLFVGAVLVLIAGTTALIFMVVTAE